MPPSPGTLPVGSVTITPQPVEVNGTVLVSRPWGDGPGAFGREPGQQAASLGPSAVAVRPDRSMLLLDTVNSRVESFSASGTANGSDQVPARDRGLADDLVVAPDTGRVYAINTYLGAAFLLGPGEHRWIDFQPARNLPPMEQLSRGGRGMIRGFLPTAFGSHACPMSGCPVAC